MYGTASNVAETEVLVLAMYCITPAVAENEVFVLFVWYNPNCG